MIASMRLVPVFDAVFQYNVFCNFQSLPLHGRLLCYVVADRLSRVACDRFAVASAPLPCGCIMQPQGKGTPWLNLSGFNQDHALAGCLRNVTYL